MKKELGDLKKLVLDLMHKKDLDSEDIEIVNRIIKDVSAYQNEVKALPAIGQSSFTTPSPEFVDANLSSEQNIVVEESLSLADKEKEMIEKALEKHRGKRKTAASELGISERTLYRKIKEYNIQL